MAEKGINQREQRGRSSTEPATLTITFGKEKTGGWDFTFKVDKNDSRDQVNTYSRYDDAFGVSLEAAERKLMEVITDAKKYVKLTGVTLRWKDGYIFFSPDDANKAYLSEGGNIFKTGIINYIQSKKGETSVWSQFTFDPVLLRSIRIKVNEQKRKQLKAISSPVVKLQEIEKRPDLRRIGSAAPIGIGYKTKTRHLAKRTTKKITKQSKQEIADKPLLPRLPQPDEEIVKRLQEGISKRRLLK